MAAYDDVDQEMLLNSDLSATVKSCLEEVVQPQLHRLAKAVESQTAAAGCAQETLEKVLRMLQSNASLMQGGKCGEDEKLRGAAAIAQSQPIVRSSSPVGRGASPEPPSPSKGPSPAHGPAPAPAPGPSTLQDDLGFSFSGSATTLAERLSRSPRANLVGQHRGPKGVRREATLERCGSPAIVDLDADVAACPTLPLEVPHPPAEEMPEGSPVVMLDESSGGKPRDSMGLVRNTMPRIGSIFSVAKSELGETMSKGFRMFRPRCSSLHSTASPVARTRTAWVHGVGRAIKDADSSNGNNANNNRNSSNVRTLTKAPSKRIERLQQESNPPATSPLHAWAITVVQSLYFDYIMCIVLVLNSITIGWQVDINGRYPDQEDPASFVVLEKLFCICFALELALRVYAFRPARFFLGSDWAWNNFDTLVVVAQLLEEVLNSVVDGLTDNSFSDNLKIVKMLRFLRLFRVLRVLRIVRFVQELNNVVYLIMGSLMSFFWTFFLMLLSVYMMGIFCAQVAAQYGGSESDETQTELRRYYGSVGDAVLTNFQAVTGGLDWKDLSAPLMEVQPFLAVIFSFYIAFTVLVMLNLVTGVFVDSARRLRSKDTEKILMRKLSRIFLQTIDDNNILDDEVPEITIIDFKKCVQLPDMKAWFESLNIDQVEDELIFRIFDVHATGSLSLEDFVARGLALQGSATAVDFARFQVQYTDDMEEIRALLSSMRTSLFQSLPGR